VLLRHLLQPQKQHRFSASFALLFIQFSFFAPRKSNALRRSADQWVSWLREQRLLFPHPLYGALGTSVHWKQEEEYKETEKHMAFGNAHHYFASQRAQFLWTATPVALLSVGSLMSRALTTRTTA